jgi:hypothetical protein
VLWCIAAANEADCKRLPCPVGMSAKLLDHECVCVGRPSTVSK